MQLIAFCLNRPESVNAWRIFVERPQFPQPRRPRRCWPPLKDHRGTQSQRLALSGMPPRLDDEGQPEEPHLERPAQALWEVFHVQLLSENLLHATISTGMLGGQAKAFKLFKTFLAAQGFVKPPWIWRARLDPSWADNRPLLGYLPFPLLCLASFTRLVFIYWSQIN